MSVTALWITLLLMVGHSEAHGPPTTGGSGDGESGDGEGLLREVLRLKRSLQLGQTPDQTAPSGAHLLRQLEADKATSTAAPVTGQRVRLVGGNHPWEGMVEVYTENGWNHVQAERWSETEAKVVCRQLGYVSRFDKPEVLHASSVGGDGRGVFSIARCDTGMESSLMQCRSSSDVTGSRDVGVVCLTERDLEGVCGEGEMPFAGRCYYIGREPRTRLKAEILCRQRGARLVAVTSQAQNDLLSSVMTSGGLAGLHTAGRSHQLKRDAVVWYWEGHKDTPFSYSRWNSEDGERLKNSQGDSSCLTLQLSTLLDGSQYAFWAASECGRNLPYACQTPQSSAECASGIAGEYQGNVSTSESGATCLPWSSVTAISGLNSSSLPNNWCRNPDGDRRPWCFVSLSKFEFCDVPACPPIPLQTDGYTSDTCNALQFNCGADQCIRLSYVCDGDRDCSNGRDEDICDAVEANFQIRESQEVKLDFDNTTQVLARYTGFNRRACRVACLIDPSCRVIEYSGRNCFTYNLPITKLNTRPDALSAVEVVRGRQSPCNGHLCDDLSCIDKASARCDRVLDCDDLSDELLCSTSAPPVRIVDGPSSSSGRLEVQLNGRWGAVCHDGMSPRLGHLACHQLGYQRMHRYLVNGKGSPGRADGHYSISFSGCPSSNETHIGECILLTDEERCVPGEHVTLECTNQPGKCTFFNNIFQCLDGSACLASRFICNGEKDCADGSDETSDICPDTSFALRPGPTPQILTVKTTGPRRIVSSRYFGGPAADYACRQLDMDADYGLATEDSELLRRDKLVSYIPCTQRRGNTTCSVSDTAPLAGERAVRLQCVRQPLPPAQLRLVPGESSSRGILEIQPPLGRWGRVCAFNFKSEQAQVACRQLGFEGQAAFKERPRAAGTFIALRAFDCRGDENSVSECLHNAWAEDDSMQACGGGGEVMLDCSARRQSETLPSQVTPSCESGVNDLERVLGGSPAQSGQHPWYTQVQKSDTGGTIWKLRCGGTIISDRFVLTVAHCLKESRLSRDSEANTIQVSEPSPVARMRVVPRDSEARSVRRAYIHPGHLSLTAQHNDIGILELEQPLQFSLTVQPACLPPPDIQYSSQLSCSISGRGRVSPSPLADLPTSLRVANVTLFTRDQCVEFYGRRNVTQGMVCAGSPTFDMDTCDGDSGGPLTCKIGTGYALMGITSWGEGCGKTNKPGVYTRVLDYLPWIVPIVTGSRVA